MEDYERAMISWLNKGIVISLLLVLPAVFGCVSARTVSQNNICPPAITPSEEEEQIMVDYMPEFFIKFTNQQIDLMECRDEI